MVAEHSPFMGEMEGASTKEKKTTMQDNLSKLSAIGMLMAGVGLTIAGFIVPPLGEISDSVLWFTAQTLIYAGSIFGVKVYIDHQLKTRH